MNLFFRKLSFATMMVLFMYGLGAFGVVASEQDSFHQTASRFVDGFVTPETKTKQTFTTFVENGVLAIRVVGDEGGKKYSGLKASTGYESFDFCGAVRVSLTPYVGKGHDEDAHLLAKLIFEGVSNHWSSGNMCDAIQPFIDQCVQKLRFYKGQLREVPKKNSGINPYGVETDTLRETLDASFKSYLGRVRAGVFHVTEFMTFAQYCNSSIKAINELVEKTRNSLAKADAKDRSVLEKKIQDYQNSIEAFEINKGFALSLLHALYPHGEQPTVWLSLLRTAPKHEHEKSLPITQGSDPRYMELLKKVLSTQCECLQTAMSKGHIVFAKPEEGASGDKKTAPEALEADKK